MSPNSNGFYKSKVFKFVNRQYQKISEKSVIALRYIKIAFESALQAIAYSAQMLVGKIKKITSIEQKIVLQNQHKIQKFPQLLQLPNHKV